MKISPTRGILVYGILIRARVTALKERKKIFMGIVWDAGLIIKMTPKKRRMLVLPQAVIGERRIVCVNVRRGAGGIEI